MVSSPLAPSLAHAAGDSQRGGDGGEERDGYLKDSFPSLAFHRFFLLIFSIPSAGSFGVGCPSREWTSIPVGRLQL